MDTGEPKGTRDGTGVGGPPQGEQPERDALLEPPPVEPPKDLGDSMEPSDAGEEEFAAEASMEPPPPGTDMPPAGTFHTVAPPASPLG